LYFTPSRALISYRSVEAECAGGRVGYHFATARERRKEYLLEASRAAAIAAEATNESVRERYLKLEKDWLTLADEVEHSFGYCARTR
jgi:hypothetical protein